MIRPGAFARSVALVLAALAFAGVAADPAMAKKKPPVVVAPPPPAPEPEIPVGPPVLAGYLIDTASAFATYVRSASAINAVFTDGPSISNALRIGGASEQHQMQQGVVAYAAIVALQDATFVDTVRGFAKHASTRDMMVRYLLDNPAYVMTLDGHDTAAARVTAALGSQAMRLKLTADQIKQQSYDVQLKGPWSKKPIPDPMGRLAQIKQLSSTPIVGADDLKVQLAGAANGSAPLPGDSSPQAPAYTDAVNRGLAVAALAVLGKAGESDMAALLPLLTTDGDSYCFNMSKLNLYQCLSVARPYYEDLFCLGVHAVGDTGRCVMSSVGMAEPVAVIPPAPPVVKTSSTSGGKAPVRRRSKH